MTQWYTEAGPPIPIYLTLWCSKCLKRHQFVLYKPDKQRLIHVYTSSRCGREVELTSEFARSQVNEREVFPW